MPASVGGTTAPLYLALFPLSWNPGAGVNFYFSTLDPTNFNDPNEGSFYNWKVEDILAGRTPTCLCAILTYRDLGVATLTCTLSGYDQNAKVPVSVSQTITIGTVAATGILCTTTPDVLGISLTAMNLQFSVTRAANGGPVSIVKVRLEGRVETTPYA